MQLLKRILQRGTGEFPIDAPIHDTSVAVHYSVYRPDAPEVPIFTSRPEPPGAARAAHAAAHAAGPGSAASGAEHPDGAAEFTTGDGAMAMGVEMALKLMLPGEQSLLQLHPDYGFGTCVDGAHAALPRAEPLLVHLELCRFARDSHPEAMDTEQVRPTGWLGCARIGGQVHDVGLALESSHRKWCDGSDLHLLQLQ